MVAAVAPLNATAQINSTIDVGAGNIHYDGSADFAVYSISPRLSLDRGYATAMAAATFSRFEGEGWGTRGMAAVSVLTPSVVGFRAEFAGKGDLHANRVVTAARQVAGAVRLHLAGTSTGAWAGASMARVWNGSFWQNSPTTDLGLWTNLARHVSARVGVARSEYALRTVTDDGIALYHAEVTALGRRGPLEFEASVGRQDGDSVDGTTTWDVNGALWLTRFVAVAVSGGKYASQPAQRLPGGSYLSLGMRLAPVRLFAQPAVLVLPSPNRRFTATAAGKGQTRTLRYFGTAENGVEVVGSFTDWRPVALRQVAPGMWEATLVIESGSHFFTIRVDSGEWFVPEGTTPVDDDFNGRVGLLVVPR